MIEETGDEPYIRDGLVWRRTRPWSANVHLLLAHLHAKGFDAAPRPAGCDREWERVTFLDGRTADLDLDLDARSDRALTSAARLLRRYHDCTVDFAAAHAGDVWQLPARAPFELICHGDFAPYNVVFADQEVSGIIDFETAHPGPRQWDLAYAVYRWAPLSLTAPAELSATDIQIGRVRRFLDAYGLANGLRAGVIDMVIERLEALVAFMEREAAGGSEKYRAHIKAGHDELYRADIAYIRRQRAAIIAAIG